MARRNRRRYAWRHGKEDEVKKPFDTGKRPPALTELHVATRRPHDYVLLDESTGQRWRGTAGGYWVADVPRTIDDRSNATAQKMADEYAAWIEVFLLGGEFIEFLRQRNNLREQYQSGDKTTPSQSFADRCRLAQECLPDAEYRTRLKALHDAMLDAISGSETVNESLTDGVLASPVSIACLEKNRG